LNPWDIVILKPILNSLVVVCNVLFHNFGLAIIVLTIVINLALLPLTLKQVKASKAMQDLQPKLAELQKKHAKDKQRLAQEQMSLYKNSGVSPAGCILPMLIQTPIWIALYQAIMRVLAVIPENLLGLNSYLYSWPIVYSSLPLNSQFLWLNLASGDMILAVLVGASMWVQQKQATPATTDPRMAQQNTMMLWMMPLMFTFLSLNFPSGLALYWVTSNLMRIGIQYKVTGWGGLISSGPKKPQEKKQPPIRLLGQ
jgi:YidC/Oxa1 family membrane protein insertase